MDTLKGWIKISEAIKRSPLTGGKRVKVNIEQREYYSPNITLTRAQYDVISALEKHNMPAAHIKPATLGALCAKKLVNVHNGITKNSSNIMWFSNEGGNYKAYMY